MALAHATSGDLVDVRPLNDILKQSVSLAVLRTDRLEVMRLVLHAGKSMREHQVPGELTIQCIEGVVDLRAHGTVTTMRMGQLVYLEAATPHALVAVEDASLLVTVLRNQH
jgi:quercetin dioxygenase-like cupin family protein